MKKLLFIGVFLLMVFSELFSQVSTSIYNFPYYIPKKGESTTCVSLPTSETFEWDSKTSAWYVVSPVHKSKNSPINEEFFSSQGLLIRISYVKTLWHKITTDQIFQYNKQTNSWTLKYTGNNAISGINYIAGDGISIVENVISNTRSLPSGVPTIDIIGNINLRGLIKLDSVLGTPGQVLTSNGESNPTWETISVGGGSIETLNHFLGNGTTGSKLRLKATGVGAGTYNSVTVDTTGRITAATTVTSFNPSAHNHAISDVTNLSTSLAAKVDKNSNITAATKTKITYDAKGLVTSGSDATTADIAESTNKKYVTDAQQTVLGNTSGSNTGDETNSSIKTKLGVASPTNDGYLSSSNWNTFNNKQNTITGSETVFNGWDKNSGDDFNGVYSNLSGIPSTFTPSIHSHTISQVTNLQDSLSKKVDKVVGSRLINSSESVLLGNTSGANTGDETTATIKTKLGVSTLSGSNTGDETLSSIKTKLGVANSTTDGYLNSTDWNIFNNKQNTITGSESVFSTWDKSNTNEIEIITTSPVTGQVATWNGSNWVNQNSASGADNWGSQNVVTHSSGYFTGNGTSISPLNLSFVPFNGAYSNLSGIPSNFTPTTHSHPQSQITNLSDSLAVKSRLGHTHAISDITNLQTSLDSKQNNLGFTPYNSTNPSNFISRSGVSSSATGLTYNNSTGVFSLTSGYEIPTTANTTNWSTAYTNRINSLTTVGSSGAATFSGNVLNIPDYSYILPTATASVLGGVKPDGTSVLNTSGVISVTKSSIGLSAVENTALSTWAGSTNITTLGNIYADRKTFSFQDLALGVGATVGRIQTDGSKPIDFYPNVGVQSTRFWPNGNVTVQTGGTFTDNGFKLEVTGTTKFNGNSIVTGNLDVSGNINTATWNGVAIPLAKGGTGATTASAARTNLGLGFVNNTSDDDKPVSAATAAELATKASITHLHDYSEINSLDFGVIGVLNLNPIESNQILDDAVGTAKIANGTVKIEDLDPSEFTSGQFLYKNGSVMGTTSLKSVNSNSLIGTGNISIPVIPSGGTTGQVLSKSSGTDFDVSWTTVSGGGGSGVTDGDKGDIDITSSGATYTIDTNSVSLSKMQQISTSTFLGRVSSGTGNVENLTATQATSVLNTFSSSLKGLAPSSGGGTTNFLRADGTWAVPPGTGGGGGGVSLPSQTGNNGKFLATDATDPYWSEPYYIGAMIPVGSVAAGSVVWYNGTTGRWEVYVPLNFASQGAVTGVSTGQIYTVTDGSGFKAMFIK